VKKVLNKNIELKIIHIVKKILKNKKINTLTGPSNCEEWDSLNHMLIITEISKYFKKKISFKEILEIHSVKDLVNIISKK
jgi:acyl carrier protein